MSPRKWIVIITLLLSALVLVLLIGLNLGVSGVTLFSPSTTFTRAILWGTRLPRLLMAALIGMALGGSGVAYQTVLRNPLADPYLLGVSGGAALGSTLGVALDLPFTFTMLCAFGCSMIVMVSIIVLAAKAETVHSHSLLLTGVIFNLFAYAIIMLTHALLPPERAHQVIVLLMGNIGVTNPAIILSTGIAVGVGLSVLIYHALPMDALILGEETVPTMGIDIARLQRTIFIASSIMVGAAVASSGLIGFVGLFVPHAVRYFTGNRHRLLLPASALIGGIFLMIADTGARTIFGRLQTELPVGIVTALIGAPIFIWLLRRQLPMESR